MTPAGEYLKQAYGDRYSMRAISGIDVENLMNHFAYQTLKNLYNSLGKEHSTDTILETISNYKAKFHHCAS